MKQIHIKNMVCPRCIDTVADIFKELDVAVSSSQLGEVEVVDALNETQKTLLEEKLIARGFELLQDQKSITIAQIKSIVIEQIHYSKEVLKVNFSTLLSDNLNQEYTSISKLFSAAEGITIERFILKQKIEKVKELIFYKELTLSEIAFQMGYSSVAHLSFQFKKETGITPTEFKKLDNSSRKSLDDL